MPPARPVLSGPEFLRETPDFVIHYTLSGADQTTIAWVESIAVSLGDCRSAFVADGWLPPPPDGGQGGDNRYDVYVADSARWGDVVPEDPFSDPYTGGYTSWMRIHPDSIPEPFPAFSRLRALLAHELHHAVQLRYRHVVVNDYERWFHENTSVYMEDVVYDDVNTLPYRLQFPGPLSDPHVRITTGTRTTQYTSWMYGGGLWPTFLDERYGEVLPLLVWARIGSDTTVSYITSTASILDSIGVMFGEALREYASWRYFTGARAAPGYFHEAGSYPTAKTLNPHQVYPEDSSLIRLEAPGGTSFVEFVMGAPGLALTVDGETDTHIWKATLHKIRSGAATVTLPLELDQFQKATDTVTWVGVTKTVLIPMLEGYGSSTDPPRFDYAASLLPTASVVFSNRIRGANIQGTNLLLDDLLTVPSGSTLALGQGAWYTVRAPERHIADSVYKHHDWLGVSARHRIVDAVQASNGLTRVANFIGTRGAVIQALVDGGSGGIIGFRDPWYLLLDGRQPDSLMQFASPHVPTGAEGASAGGVFLDQDYNVPGNPYYSVCAPDTQSIGGLPSYFLRWDANPNSAAFQYPGNTTTGVVFKQPNATVTAVYKAPLVSSTPAATGANNQRKIVTASNGVSHAVYESGGSIWYTRSNGSGWTLEKPLRLFTNAKYPAIAWGYVAPSIWLHVAWQESVYAPYVGWRKRVCYVRSTDAGTTWGSPIPVCGGPFGDIGTSTDVDPLPAVATGGGATVAVIWRKHDDYGIGLACRADPWDSSWSIQNVPATDGTTETPALAGADGWKLAYGKDAGKILYREFTINPTSGIFTFAGPVDLTAGYPWMVESNRPSIASSAGRTIVVWEGAKDQVVEEEDESPLSGAGGRRQVFLREKTSVWQPVTELSYYWGTDEITPVVGLDNSKVTVLWNWGVTGLAKASRDLIGSSWSVAHVGYGYWPALAEFTQIGTPLRMSTGVPGPPHAVQFQQDPPSSPLADSKAGDEPEVSGAGRGVLVSRTATLVLDSLSIPSLGRGAVSGRVIVTAYLPEVRTESGRLPVSFRRDTLKFERWLETEGTAISPNATEARLPVALSLRAIRINNPGVPTSLPVLRAGMRAGSKSTELARVTIGDLLASAGRDTTIRIVSVVALDRHRNATLEFTQRLSGVEEDLVAWTEMVSADTTLDAEPAAAAPAAKQPAAATLLPEAFLIRDAFPNPFNPSTEIRYELPELARVSLTVYDVLGRVVETLIDETKGAGYHAVHWNATGRSSGVYLARFTATTATGRVVLQRTTKLVLTK